MANGVERESELVVMFSEEELSEMSGVRRCLNYIEVTCGCTSHRYGDAVGRLRVFQNGDLEISCECTPGCQEEKLTPAAFEKHSGRETARKWKNNVWVIVNEEKVPLFKTVLLKYYNQASKNANGSHRSHNGRACHRDEFIPVLGATRIEGFVCGQKRNVGFIMMLWQIQIGNVLICHMTKFHAMMMKNEQVAGCTGAAPGLQHARVALLVCVLDVKSAVSQIAAARLVSTLR